MCYLASLVLDLKKAIMVFSIAIVGNLFLKLGSERSTREMFYYDTSYW
jgi:hypothetical protein